jgi:anti-sigma factor RsiW
MAADSRSNAPPGGLACAEVLAYLSDFVDDQLTPPVRSQVVAHVEACPNCARFGGAFAEVIGRLRAATPEPEHAPEPFDLQRLFSNIENLDAS